VNRTEKQQEVDRLREQFGAVRHAFLIDFKGVTVPAVSRLRREVQKAGAHYQVVKNTMLIRAVEGKPLGALKEHFSGPTAVAWHEDDPVPLAKVLKEFAAGHPVVSFKAALVDGQQLEGKQVAEVANLPGLDELRAKLVFLLASPMRRLATVLAGPSRGLATALGQRAKKLE
jgi:large subunit ribosomal protein L10